MFRISNLTMIALGLTLGSCLTPAHAMMSFRSGGLGTHIASAPALRAGPGPSRALPSGVGGGHPVSRFVSGGINAGKFAVAGQAAKINQIGPAPVTPNVVGREKTITGLGGQASGPNQPIPGIGSTTNTSGPRVNVPGGSIQQTGVRAVPGFENATNGTQVNLPGTTNTQHTPSDAQNVINKLTQQQIGIVNQPLGGFNNLNIPTRSAAGVDVSDNTGRSGSGSGVPGGTRGTSSKKPGGDTSSPGGNVNEPQADPDQVAAMGVVQAGEGIGQIMADKTGKDAKSTKAEAAAGVAGGQSKSELFDIPKPVVIKDKKKGSTPDDNATTAVTGSSQLDPHSGIARRDQGGGTGNNTETASGKSGTLTPGSAYARKNNGDGSDGRGDNGHADKSGTLAAGTPISRVGDGDGGTADSRGGSGSTQIPGTIHGDPGGGVHNQMGLKATAQP